MNSLIQKDVQISSNNYVENLKKLVYFYQNLMKDLQKVQENISKYQRKIFNPSEFYNHICVIFTKCPINQSKKEEKIKNNLLKK